MHEATLAARMLQIAQEAASSREGYVESVTVIVGELAGVMLDSLAFAFDALKKRTRLENAVLKIEKQPALAQCRDCGTEYAPAGFPFLCPHCGSNAFRIVRGEEVFVKDMEMRA